MLANSISTLDIEEWVWINIVSKLEVLIGDEVLVIHLWFAMNFRCN